jgi:hypothetical protein
MKKRLLEHNTVLTSLINNYDKVEDPNVRNYLKIIIMHHIVTQLNTMRNADAPRNEIEGIERLLTKYKVG